MEIEFSGLSRQLVVLAFGGATLLQFGALWFAIKSEFWPWVDARILEAGVEREEDSEGGEYFVPRLRYEYRVAGKTYTGKRLAFRPKGSHRAAVVAKQLEGIAAGAMHRVYFAPRYPRLCVLVPGPSKWNYIVLGFLAGATLLAAVAPSASAGS